MTRRDSERGMSLIEVLVATGVLSLVIIIALSLYDAARKAFSKGENATESQESVRIAFDKISTDLRMLGYNTNPDGNPGRPDEQLEAALDHAVILRADFDRADDAASIDPEASLAGGAFTTVSTGNDEIVGYVLAKPDGSGPDTITFQADVGQAKRDGTVEPVSIPNVVLNPTSPPYTLYRVTLNNDSNTYGSPSFVVRTPVVENVRDLTFVYYGSSGTFKDASGTVAETDVAKGARSGLTRTHVSLVGMTRQQDLSYNDTTDSLAPKNRKFELAGDVTPRNMRLRGIQDLNADVTPPGKPATPILTPGHCGGLIVTWAANPLSDAVAQYRISWGPTSSIVTGSRNVPGSPFFLDGLADATNYFVTIKAQDAEGNLSVPSDQASVATSNTNRPSPPSGFTTSTNQTYHVAVSWSPVTTNDAAVPAADPQAPQIRDLAGYRLYWHFDTTVDPDPRKLLVKEDVLSASAQPPYYDAPLVACVDRFYVMTAVDTCGRESVPTPVSKGRVANAGVQPKAPINVQAHYTSSISAHIKWKHITHDVNEKEIKIERYEVYRSQPIDGGASSSSAVWGPTPAAVVYTNYWEDPNVPPVGPGEVLYYRVQGGDYCDNDSDFSAPARLECTFTGDVDIVTPQDGKQVSGFVTTTVKVTGGSESYVQLTLSFVDDTGRERDRYVSPYGPATTWTYSWHAVPQGPYTITATVETDAGCKQTDVIDVTAENSSQ
jgi:type II secretory pathway pseudopilin PulG